MKMKSTKLALAGALVSAMGCSGCSSADHSDAAATSLTQNGGTTSMITQSASAPSLANDSSNLSPMQKNKIEEISNVFENSTPDFLYGYIEDIGDGAGVTAGRVGFNLAAGDLQTVVYDYVQAKQNQTPLANPAYISCLQNFKQSQTYACLYPSMSTVQMSSSDFMSGAIASVDFGLAWTNAAQDPVMQQLQDSLIDQGIFAPALVLAQKYGIKSAFGVAVVYDTVLQEGPFEGGFASIVRRTEKAYSAIHPGQTNPADGADEIAWLNLFLLDRVDTLRYGFDANDVRNTAENAYVSYPRAESLLQILNSGNYSLNQTVVFDYFGDHFELTK